MYWCFDKIEDSAAPYTVSALLAAGKVSKECIAAYAKDAFVGMRFLHVGDVLKSGKDEALSGISSFLLDAAQYDEIVISRLVNPAFHFPLLGYAANVSARKFNSGGIVDEKNPAWPYTLLDALFQRGPENEASFGCALTALANPMTYHGTLPCIKLSPDFAIALTGTYGYMSNIPAHAKEATTLSAEAIHMHLPNYEQVALRNADGVTAESLEHLANTVSRGSWPFCCAGTPALYSQYIGSINALHISLAALSALGTVLIGHALGGSGVMHKSIQPTDNFATFSDSALRRLKYRLAMLKDANLKSADMQAFDAAYISGVTKVVHLLLNKSKRVDAIKDAVQQSTTNALAAAQTQTLLTDIIVSALYPYVATLSTICSAGLSSLVTTIGHELCFNADITQQDLIDKYGSALANTFDFRDRNYIRLVMALKKETSTLSILRSIMQPLYEMLCSAEAGFSETCKSVDDMLRMNADKLDDLSIAAQAGDPEAQTLADSLTASLSVMVLSAMYNAYRGTSSESAQNSNNIRELTQRMCEECANTTTGRLSVFSALSTQELIAISSVAFDNLNAATAFVNLVRHGSVDRTLLAPDSFWSDVEYSAACDVLGSEHA